MIRTLFIIAGASLVLCLGSLAGAAALGSRDLASNDWTWVVTESGEGNGDLRFERGKVSPDATRTLPWTSGQSLTVDLPADVTYVQGGTPGVVISGPKAAVDRVRLIDGRLSLIENELNERGYIRVRNGGIRIWNETEMLKITITAPNVNSFRLAGSGDLTVEGYNQPSLNLLLDGSGDVEVIGRATSLDVRLNGYGDADLQGLEVTNAKIDNAGEGEINVGPTGDVTVDVTSDGDVHLTRRPAKLERNITGDGEITGA